MILVPRTEYKKGRTGKGNLPGQQWQTDFYGIARKKEDFVMCQLVQSSQRLSVAGPTKLLLQKIIPRIGIPATTSSD